MGVETHGRSARRFLLAPVVVLGVVAAVFAASPAAAQGPAANATIVVDSTADGADQNLGDGVCATSSGACTLRAAIAQANANRGPDRIEFSIGGSGVKTIDLTDELPTIDDSTGGLVIDGYTQPGASPNTATHGSNAVIRIEVDGTNQPNAFVIQSAENTIRGLSIYGAIDNIELRNEAADGNRIIGNFLGTNAAGTTRRGDVGVHAVLGPDRNMIGTPQLADRNVIGFVKQGVRIDHGETSENRIQNNVIGLSPDGTLDIGGSIGIDIQWWTWGNLVGGSGPGEANVVGGSGSGIDLSHKATGNLVLNNLVGTTLDGTSATNTTRNGRGLIVKDDAQGNYFADNVVAGATNDYAIWHKHNYSGGNTFVNNRVGVTAGGNDIGSNDSGMILRGHDDVYVGNIIANMSGPQAVLISNTSVVDGATFEPAEQTVNNAVRQGTYYNNSASKAIVFGSECCPHPNEDTPDVDGLGPGQVNGNSTCAGCEVEVYVSGSVAADGTLTPGTGTTGLTWIGTVTADGSGAYSMASPLLTAGSRVNVKAITPNGESSDFMNSSPTIPAQGSGLVANPDQPNPVAPLPPSPPLPTPYAPTTFDCSHANGTLSWDDAGAPEYYVFATSNGTESYLGGHSATILAVSGADSYRVEHWVTGWVTNAVCDGPGAGTGGGSFDCSYATGTLSWTDAGAPEYYVFANTGGTETYLGGHTATSLTAPGADSYRIEHWITGQVTNATCNGPGPDAAPSFDCSVTGSTLSWDDAGAAAYYVFAVNGGTETYLGGHSTTSLTVAPADTYRVEHWITGQATNATCGGAGGVTFDCSVSNGTLSWTDVGAPEYYVFASTGGTESYLGGHSATSLAVAGADSYRIEHWITGQVTNAVCNG
ncbi:MAG: CSLREA domain-containing protein [Actinomycetota bacterium]